MWPHISNEAQVAPKPRPIFQLDLSLSVLVVLEFDVCKRIN